MPVENITEPSVWEKLFEQTPRIIRYALAVLTLGVFALAGLVWRWNREDVRRVEQKIDRTEAARRQEIGELHRRIDYSDQMVTQRLDEVNTHLIQIAQNTNRSQRNDEY